MHRAPPTTLEEMKGSLSASSSKPPAAPTAAARYAPWALLDKKVHFADRENDTTTEAVTSTGHTVKVTFCQAEPPAVSHFCVHGPKFKRDDFTTEPLVLFSAKDLVLLRFAFTIGPRSTRRDPDLAEYFVYKAGRGNPSLKSIPCLPTTPLYHADSLNFCILPFDDDDGEFLIADLCMTERYSKYELLIFSSKTGKWTTMPLKVQTSPGVKEEDLPHYPLHKVISLGGGEVGWVDLWRGIVCCNVFDENPVLRFIPIPRPETNHRLEGDPRHVRDVNCHDGFIKFVELDLRFKQILMFDKKSCKMTKDLDSVDIIYDSEMLFHNDDSRVKRGKRRLVSDGWRLRTCYRHSSWDYWRKGHTVDIDEILADNPGHPLLLPQLWDAKAGRWTLRNLISAYPTLGIDNDSRIYMMSKVKFDDKDAWMIGVDLEKKMVEVLVHVSSKRFRDFNPDFLTCAFPEYLTATPSNCLRLCAQEFIPAAPNGAQNYVLSGDLSSGYRTPNEPAQHQYTYGVHPGYGNYQQLTLHPTTSSGSGHAYPMNAQLISQDAYQVISQDAYPVNAQLISQDAYPVNAQLISQDASPVFSHGLTADAFSQSCFPLRNLAIPPSLNPISLSVLPGQSFGLLAPGVV